MVAFSYPFNVMCLPSARHSCLGKKNPSTDGLHGVAVHHHLEMGKWILIQVHPGGFSQRPHKRWLETLVVIGKQEFIRKLLGKKAFIN